MNAVRDTDTVVTGAAVTTPWGDDPTARIGAWPADWFDVRAQLAPRGYKYLPPACQYLLAAAKRAVDWADLPLPAVERGVVVGTNRGCARLHADMDHTVITGSADELSPAFAPFFAINVLASRASIEYDCKAFNVTVTSPMVAGLESVQVGARALAAGRATAVLVGATEAEPDEIVGLPPEAGAAVLLLETRESAARRGANVLGDCRTRTAFVPPSDPSVAGPVVKSVRDGWDARVTLFADDSPVADAVAEALGDVTVLPVGAGCLGPTWHLTRLLTAGEPGVVAVATRTGNVAITSTNGRASRC